MNNNQSILPRGHFAGIMAHRGSTGYIENYDNPYAPINASSRLSNRGPPLTLPSMRQYDHNSTKSLRSASGGAERVSSYQNEAERQDVMKRLNEQQAKYQRLIVKQRPSNQAVQIPMKSKTSQLEYKNLASLQKAKKSATGPRSRY